MPTGYTSGVVSGEITTLRQYALCCARAMSALISMRDEPHNAPIPREIPDDIAYYDECIKDAEDKFKWVSGLSYAECEAEAIQSYTTSSASFNEYLNIKKNQKQRYESMLDKVLRWTTDAVGIRDFMISQLRESISFDCGEESPEPIKLSGVQWRQEIIAKTTKDIEYYRGRREVEILRNTERNRWLADLFKSLPEEEI